MSGLSILYVDDDADIRTVAGMALSLDPSIAVAMAASGQEALAAVAGGPVPDAAVLDMMMPGMTGLELMERLRADPATAALPVIVTTAKARAADVAAYRAAGAIGVILKPFDPLTLAAQIRRTIEAHRAGESAAFD